MTLSVFQGVGLKHNVFFIKNERSWRMFV